MSLEEQRQFLEDVSDEVTKHSSLYKTVDIKSVVARRDDIPNRMGKWHNVATLAIMLPSSKTTPWKKKVEKENFAILSATLTIDSFMKILKSLVEEQNLKIEKYRAFGSFDFGQKEFVNSSDAKQLANIPWAINSWLIAGKEKLGPPSDRSLELESEAIPFKHAAEAIRYHFNLTHESYNKIRDSIYIAAPLYYARIEHIELSGRSIKGRIYRNLASITDLKVIYNTEGPQEDTNYYKTVEIGSIQPKKDTILIDLKHDAMIATIWLRHTNGFMIDSSRVWRIPSIETLETQLQSDNVYVSEDVAKIITETVIALSKANIADLLTTEYLVDSIDIEILKAVKTIGGDYADCIPEVLKYLSLNLLLSRLARLRTLGFLKLQPPRKILLTSLAVDALNLPPSALKAKVPADIAGRIAEINLAFRNENFDEVSNKTTKLIEVVLRNRLQERFAGTLKDVWPNLKLGPFDRASLGTLKEACLRLNVLEKNGLADHILSTILKLRVPMSHEKGEITTPADIASLIVRLVEAFVREWYYLET